MPELESIWELAQFKSALSAEMKSLGLKSPNEYAVKALILQEDHKNLTIDWVIACISFFLAILCFNFCSQGPNFIFKCLW